jgi:hypothetical protein
MLNPPSTGSSNSPYADGTSRRQHHDGPSSHRDATSGHPYGSLRDVQARLERGLPSGGEARAWLDGALTEAARAPEQARWELHFASAGRHCGRSAATDARVLILHAAGAGAATLGRLYRQGTAAERAAVLSALHLLPDGRTPEAVPFVEDALRANDTTLIAAAAGPYAAAHLDDHAWRHAVLKCLFTGVSLDAVAGLARRARGDAELARMLGDFAAERAAAGRPVPPDLDRALDLTGHARGQGDRRVPSVPPQAPGEAVPHAPGAPAPEAPVTETSAPEIPAPAPPPEEF